MSLDSVETPAEESYPTADAFELSERTLRSTQARVSRVRALLDEVAKGPAGEDTLVRVRDIRRALGSDGDVPARQFHRPRLRDHR